MASNAKNLAELLNTDSTVAVGDIADGSVSTAKLADDAVTSAKLGASAVDATALASNAVTTAKIADDAVTQAKTTGVGAGKNVIINGGMTIAQRGTSSSGLGGVNGYFTCDRYRHVFNTSGRLTSSQETDSPAGFANSLKFACTTADTSIASGEYFFLQQKIEGLNLQQFAKGTSDAKAFAVSFYVKGNAAATYVVELYDADNNRQVSKSFSVTTSWNRVELIFPADTTGAFDNDANTSLNLTIWLHAGSDFTSGTLNQTWGSVTNANRVVGATSFFDSTSRTFFITGLKMETVQVTDFEHQPISEELLHCQRYYQTGHYRDYYKYGKHTGSGYCQVPAYIPMKVNFRAAPAASAVTLSASSGISASLGSIAGVDHIYFQTWQVNSSDTFGTLNFTYYADAEL